MKTLYGDKAGKVVALAAELSQTCRCLYEDNNGRCGNSRTAESEYCIWHDELMALRDKAKALQGGDRVGREFSSSQ